MFLFISVGIHDLLYTGTRKHYKCRKHVSAASRLAKKNNRLCQIFMAPEPVNQRKNFFYCRCFNWKWNPFRQKMATNLTEPHIYSKLDHWFTIMQQITFTNNYVLEQRKFVSYYDCRIVWQPRGYKLLQCSRVTMM